MWRWMHLADWNGVPSAVRAAAFDRMFDRYRSVLMNPSVWDVMQPRDWDLIPQPMRTVAYRQMVADWTGYYRLGTTHGLSQQLTSETVSAFILSESWSITGDVVNPDGSRDIGLAQAWTSPKTGYVSCPDLGLSTSISRMTITRIRGWPRDLPWSGCHSYSAKLAAIWISRHAPTIGDSPTPTTIAATHISRRCIGVSSGSSAIATHRRVGLRLASRASVGAIRMAVDSWRCGTPCPPVIALLVRGTPRSQDDLPNAYRRLFATVRRAIMTDSAASLSRTIRFNPC